MRPRSCDGPWLQTLGGQDAGHRAPPAGRDGRARDRRRGPGPGGAGDHLVRAVRFPESHAASFALIVYASAYLKAHHPTAFYTGLLNAWPMGFYHPSTLIQDAMRHGSRCGRWRCSTRDGGVAGRKERCASACGTSRSCGEPPVSGSRRSRPARRFTTAET